MIHVHSMVWGAHISAHIDEKGYEIALPQWSGRQTDVSQIDALILFLQMVRGGATPLPDEALPPVSSPSLIKQAVDEALAEEYDFPMFDIIEDDLPSRIDAFEAAHPECIPGDLSWLDDDEDYEEGCGCGGDPYCPRCFPVEKPNDLSWLDDDDEEAAPVDMTAFEAKQEADHAELVAQEEAGWLTPATDEELAGQSSNSGDLFDDDDGWDDEDFDYTDTIYHGLE